MLSNQTLLDIAVQEFGNPQAAFDIACYNGLSISDPLYTGQRLLLPQSDYQEPQTKEYYRVRGIKPATATDEMS
ncbi:MAG: hypothetical protein V6Z82_04720 [Flavobacteriales bacterium]